jgi:tetratricopeptide (TPR) repeat protein
MSSYLPFSMGSLGNSYGWRSTYLFHKEDKELSGLRLAGVATVDVYVIGAAQAGDPAAARREADELALIRKGLPQTRDYDWSGSIRAQWTVLALITWAEGSRAEAIQMLRAAADHEDSVDKHPVTPGPLLPARETLADLLMDAGSATAALKEYEAVLKTSPRRFNATAGAAKAAEKSGDRSKARAYATQLLDLTSKAEGYWPELEWARAYLGHN